MATTKRSNVLPRVISSLPDDFFPTAESQPVATPVMKAFYHSVKGKSVHLSRKGPKKQVRIIRKSARQLGLSRGQQAVFLEAHGAVGTIMAYCKGANKVVSFLSWTKDSYDRVMKLVTSGKFMTLAAANCGCIAAKWLVQTPKPLTICIEILQLIVNLFSPLFEDFAPDFSQVTEWASHISKYVKGLWCAKDSKAPAVIRYNAKTNNLEWTNGDPVLSSHARGWDDPQVFVELNDGMHPGVLMAPEFSRTGTCVPGEEPQHQIYASVQACCLGFFPDLPALPWRQNDFPFVCSAERVFARHEDVAMDEDTEDVVLVRSATPNDGIMFEDNAYAREFFPSVPVRCLDWAPAWYTRRVAHMMDIPEYEAMWNINVHQVYYRNTFEYQLQNCFVSRADTVVEWHNTGGHPNNQIIASTAPYYAGRELSPDDYGRTFFRGPPGLDEYSDDDWGVESDDDFELEAHAFTETALNLSPYISGLGVVIGMVMMGLKVKSSHDITKRVSEYASIAKNFSALNRATMDVKGIIVSVFQTVQSFITGHVARSLVGSSQLCRRAGITDEFVDNVEKMLDPLLLNEVLSNPDSRDHLNVYLDVMRRYLHVRTHGEEKAAYLAVQKLYLKLDHFAQVNAAVMLSRPDGSRWEPTHISFFGDPGLRKTDAMRQLLRVLLQPGMFGVGDLPNDRITTHSMTKHQDLYRDQSCILWDDLFSTRGSSAENSEYAHFLMMVGSAETAVPKAGVPDKGTTYANLRLLGSTTNSWHVKPSELMSPQALYRRFHSLWHVKESLKPMDSMYPGVSYTLIDPLNEGASVSPLTTEIRFEDVVPIEIAHVKERNEVERRRMNRAPINVGACGPPRVRIPANYPLNSEVVVVDNSAEIFDEMETAPTIPEEEEETPVFELASHGKGILEDDSPPSVVLNSSKAEADGMAGRLKRGAQQSFDTISAAVAAAKETMRKRQIDAWRVAVKAPFEIQENLLFTCCNRFLCVCQGEDRPRSRFDSYQCSECDSFECECELGYWKLFKTGVSEMGSLLWRQKFWVAACALLVGAVSTAFAFREALSMFGTQAREWAMEKVLPNAEDFVAFFPAWAQKSVSRVVFAKMNEIDEAERVVREVILESEGALVYDKSSARARTLHQRVKNTLATHGMGDDVKDAILTSLISEGQQYVSQREKIQKNVFSIRKMKDGNWQHVVNGVFMHDNVALVPNHVWQFIPDGEVKLCTSKGEKVVAFRKGDVQQIGTSDAARWLPDCRTLGLFSAINHFLIAESDIGSLMNVPIGVVQSHNVTETRGKLSTVEAKVKGGPENNPEGDFHINLLARSFIWTGTSYPGLCGAPGLVINDKIPASFFGIHAAGGDGVGHMTLVSREMWDEVDPRELSAHAREAEEELIPYIDISAGYEKSRVSFDEPITFVGIVKPRYIEKPPKKSAFSISELASTFKALTGEEVFPTARTTPAFSLNDPRVSSETKFQGVSPSSKGLNKFSKPVKEFSRSSFAMASQTITLMMSMLTPSGLTKRTLDENESLNGIQELQKVDMNTSVGFPWKYLCSARGKRGFLNQLADGTISFFDDEFAPRIYGLPTGAYLRLKIQQLFAKLRQGETPIYLAFENLKDELRKNQKVKDGDTRTFDCLPLDINLVTRQLFGAWMIALQQHAVDACVSVGISAQGPDWFGLYERLNKFGGDVIAGDYGNWDGKLLGSVMTECGQIINKWYGGEASENLARSALIESYIHTFIISENAVVQKHQGMPSGTVLTAPLNSLCNAFYLVAAVTSILETKQFSKIEKREITPQFLMENMEMALYGDDHVLAMSALLRKYVTFQDIQSLFMDMGMVYTDSQKRDNLTAFDFEKLTEITYLKRKFVPVEGDEFFVRAPLEISSITDMIVWTRESAKISPLESLLERIKAFSDEIIFHSDAVFMEKTQRVNEMLTALREVGCPLVSGIPNVESSLEIAHKRVADIYLRT